MTDNLSKRERSAQMRLVRSRDTRPEIAVRKVCRDAGFRGYRLHRKDLPGKPDIAFISRKKAIFVHGCFWHGHDCTGGVRMPKTNQEYWLSKIEKNRLRDKHNIEVLDRAGWDVLVVWECETKARKLDSLKDKVSEFLRKA